MKTPQWVRFAVLAVSGVGIVTLDLLTHHYTGAGMIALFIVILLDAWCGINANETEKRIDDLQREVRLLASKIERGEGLPPTETGIIEK